MLRGIPTRTLARFALDGIASAMRARRMARKLK
jgi:hypothetical protein